MLTYDEPLNIEDQILLMKKYIVFSRKTKLRKLLKYTGYYRASRYGKFLLSNTDVLGRKPEQDLLFNIYDFDVKLREVLKKYCEKAEIQFKSHLSNSISIKTSTGLFYLDDNFYTPSKSDKDKIKRQSNIKFFKKFKEQIENSEIKLRRDSLKYPELKKYRTGGKKSKNKLPCWIAFSYFEFGSIVHIYSYLKGDLRKEVLVYGYTKTKYGKEVTKEMDTWLDAVRNLRNVCAHQNILVGRTSSIVLFNIEDDDCSIKSNTDLFSRLYALKKILNSSDAELLKNDLKKIINKSKIDIYSLNILPNEWEKLYNGIKSL